MSDITIERLGGFAGFGGAGSHLVSIGQCDLISLPKLDQQSLKALFKLPNRASNPVGRDQFNYRITWKQPDGKVLVVVVDEASAPASLVATITDKIK